jgi:hypothetical protein
LSLMLNFEANMTTVLEFKTAEDKEIEDYRKASRMCAKLNHIFYQAHVDAGFTPDQAMKLMCVQSQIYDVE